MLCSIVFYVNTTIKNLGVKMPKDLLNEEEITLEKLREQFQNNDFTKTALKSYSEYRLEDVEFHNEIRSYIHNCWRDILNDLGIKNPEACFSKNYPPELIREYLERLVADIIISILYNEKALENIISTFIIPIFEQENCDELAERYLHNTVNALMQTVDIKGLAEVSREYSSDEDFGNGVSINYPKIDHERKWNHSRSKIKTESLDELLENDKEDVAKEVLDIETLAITNVALKEIIENADEQERRILELLAAGRAQSEIAKELGVSQGTISKKLAKIRNTYKTEK